MSRFAKSPIIYAHRGASYELPENTIEAFELALSLGADAIETDAHMTRDGRVVLSHDANGARMAGVDRSIASTTWSEVRAWNVGTKFEARGAGTANTSVAAAFDPQRVYRIPLLEAALLAFPDVLFNVDAKQTEPSMIPALIRAIRNAKAEDRVRIASFSSSNLQQARSLGYAGETCLSANELARLMFVPKSALKWLRVDGNAAQVPRRAYGVSFASQGAIDRLHAVGVRVDFWTINSREEASQLFARGADGVMTDDPRTLCSAELR